jgi:hypothetical protein
MAAGVTSSIMLHEGALLGAALVMTLWLQRDRPHRLAAIMQLLSGALFVVAGVAAYFWARGGLPDLIYANFIWPVHNYSEVNRVP